jgi:hypothetical protein
VPNPTASKSIPVTFASSGIVLKSAPDELPITAYKALVNCFTDQENSISVRRGFSRLNDGLTHNPHSFFFLKDFTGQSFRYAIANSTLWVAPVSPIYDDFTPIVGSQGILSVAADPRAIFASYTLVGNEMHPYIFMADGTQFLKHPGGAANPARRVGIPKPVGSPTVEFQENTVSIIEACEDSTEWTADGAAKATIGAGAEGNAISVTIAGASSAGGVYKATEQYGYPVIMDLGAEDLDEVIEVWLQFPTAADALNCSQIVLAFGLSLAGDDKTFATRYEKAIVPSDYEAASQLGSTGRTETYDSDSEGAFARLFWYRSTTSGPLEALGLINRTVSEQDQGDQSGAGTPKAVWPGYAVWNRVRIKKSEFNRVGESALTRPDLNWSTVTAVRIDVTTNDGGGSTVYVDEIQYLLTGKLFGQDIQWVYTFYDSKTNTESDFSEISAAPYPGANYDQFKLTLQTNPLTTAPLANPDKIRIYRMGGTLTQFQLVDEIDYVAGVNPVFIDNVSDQLMGSVLELDNQLPPIRVKGVELHDNRLWTWGGYIEQDQFSIETASWVAGVATVTTVLPHGYAIGDLVQIIAASVAGYVGEYTIASVPATDQFTVALVANPGGVANSGSVWRLIPEPPNRVRFSKKVDVEHFPASNYIYAGTGSEQVQRCMEHDGELFIYTLTRVYRVAGGNEATYEAVPTAVHQGLRSPHGISRGLRGLYMHAYDGIYEFPSGRKISETINQVFFGATINEIPPIAAGMESYSAMGFWDSKIYFSYRSTTEPSITNDRMLVWDTIYERWHFYLYGAQALFLEPENNILVGGNLVQWDSIVDGVAANFSYSGPWPMRLENGFADTCYAQGEDDVRGIFWAVDTREYDLGFPDQEKRFIDFVMDADTQGVPIALQVAFDPAGSGPVTADHEPMGTFSTYGRAQTIMPVPMAEGDSRLAKRVQIRLIAKTDPTATALTRIYKLIHRILLEPPRHKTFVTEWSDYGVASPKFFRELWIELDTFGAILESIEVQIDQALAYVIICNTVSTGQMKFFYGMPPDLRGTLARLKIIPAGDAEVKLYDHGFQVMAEPPPINSQQTPYSDEGWHYNKLWKEVVLDIDTMDNVIPWHFWLDGKITQSFDIQTDCRREVTISLEKDMIGKLGRLTVDENCLDECCLPVNFRYYGHHYIIQQEPADVTLADSYEQLLNYDRFKILKRFWISMKNPDCDVSMEIWVDGVLKATKVIPADPLASGHSKRRVDLKSALKGKLFRIIFSGPFAFEIYWEKSEVEMKGLNPEDGYQPYKLAPPQTF